MSSDNASPFDLNDESTIPVVMNLAEINYGQWEILWTPVEVGTSLSQDADERLRRNQTAAFSTSNLLCIKQLSVNAAIQLQFGKPSIPHTLMIGYVQ